MEYLYKAPDKHDIERFNVEINFISYIAHRVADEKKRGYSKTEFTKIIANYVQDWDILMGRAGGYKPFMGIKPNPYGIVAAIPHTITDYPAPVYMLGSIASEKGLWEFVKKDSCEQIVMLSDSITLEEKLLNIDETTEFDFGIGRHQLGVASFLSEVYSKFNREELNILASHRNIANSKNCIEYLFRVWETEYQRFIHPINSPWNMAPDALKNVLRMVACCEQIELKTKYTLYGIKTVTEKLKDVGNRFDSDLGAAFIFSIVDKIERDLDVSTGSLVLFHQYYLGNREYLYPITKTLLDTIPDDLDRAAKSKIVNMDHVLNAHPIIDSEVNPIEIANNCTTQQLIMNVEDAHDKIVSKFGQQLRPFKESGRKTHYKNEDWETHD